MWSQYLRWFTSLLIGTALSMPAAAEFKGPLEVPAAMCALAQTTRLMAVARAGSRMVVVGPRGHILLSDDGAQTWRQVAVPLSSDLVAVTFPSPTMGWAVGHDGVVLHSADGGLTWVKQLDGKQAAAIIDAYYRKQPVGAEMPNVKDQVGRLVEEGADKPFFDVLFLNEQEGFVIGAFNLAMRTKDGGKNWEPLIDRMANEQGFHLYSLAASDSDVFIAGEQGLIRRWDPGHERFIVLESPYHGSFFGILAKGSTLIAYGMRGNIVRSGDGGKTWRAVRGSATDGITGGTVMDDGRIVLATQGGEILVSKDDGESFTSVKVVNRAPFYGVAAARKDAVVVVGARGVSVVTVE